MIQCRSCKTEYPDEMIQEREFIFCNYCGNKIFFGEDKKEKALKILREQFKKIKRMYFQTNVNNGNGNHTINTCMIDLTKIKYNFVSGTNLIQIKIPTEIFSLERSYRKTAAGKIQSYISSLSQRGTTDYEKKYGGYEWDKKFEIIKLLEPNSEEYTQRVLKNSGSYKEIGQIEFVKMRGLFKKAENLFAIYEPSEEMKIPGV